MRQYVTYDYDSFIADVGGYLGLLLGYSVLSLFQDAAGIVEKIKFRLGRK